MVDPPALHVATAGGAARDPADSEVKGLGRGEVYPVYNVTPRAGPYRSMGTSAACSSDAAAAALEAHLWTRSRSSARIAGVHAQSLLRQSASRMPAATFANLRCPGCNGRAFILLSDSAAPRHSQFLLPPPSPLRQQIGIDSYAARPVTTSSSSNPPGYVCGITLAYGRHSDGHDHPGERQYADARPEHHLVRWRPGDLSVHGLSTRHWRVGIPIEKGRSGSARQRVAPRCRALLA